MTTKMQQTRDLGVELWNDSCALNELKDAVAEGFVGATSNPVIVAQAVNADKARWLPVLDGLVRDNARATEDDLAWKLIAEVVKEGAALLKGKGVLCAQVSPKYWRDARRMLDHGKELASLAENIAIKAPAVPAGIEAMEELVAAGVPVNATVSFSVSQAVAVAEAIARGEKRATSAGKKAPRSVITLMIGRVDDHVKRVVDKDKITIDPAAIHWSGIAVFKNAVRVFKERGLKTTLLAAAYRHQLHWSELIGSGIVQTIPYAWWKQFNASDVTPQRTLDNPVDEKIMSALRRIPDFRRAYDDGGMKSDELATYGATVHTLKQFLDGYSGLVQLVRDRMLP